MQIKNDRLVPITEDSIMSIEEVRPINNALRTVMEHH